MINLGYSQHCLSFGDAGSNLRECLVYFFFVHEDGEGLEKISSLFNEIHLEVSIDEFLGLKK